MKSGSIPIFALAALGLLAGCTSSASGPVAITKVNPYHLYDSQTIKTEDRMIRFEKARLLRGALENADQRERYGNYFTVFWNSKTRNPATVRFEYRQGSTGPRVHVQEVQVANPKRSNETKFQVTGDDYHQNGKVTQWKASIIEDGNVVAEYKSYLWQ